MKERLLNYLVCPSCRGGLRLADAEEENGDIKTGHLQCEKCSARYPIRNFIPRFVGGGLDQFSRQTQRAWGYQWRVFDELHQSYREQFLDWIKPVGPEFFRDKVVADAGCGMGRFTRLAAGFGAREVIGFDISPAVETARKLTGGMPNIHFIQADIHSLPLKREFDFVYSIGVLHHLSRPYRGFRNLCRLLVRGGAISVWVYGYENNEMIVKYLNPLREKVTSRLPLPLLYFFSLLVNAPLYLLLKCIYLPAEKLGPFKFLQKILPYYGYLSWLARYGFRHNHHVVFDHLVAPVAHYIPRGEIAGWFEKEGLSQVSITSRNNNSWRGYGIRY